MACLGSGFRLDDSARQSLGMLPRDDKYQDECKNKSGDEKSDNDYDDYDDDSESGEWGRRVSPHRTMELARFLEESQVGVMRR